uniref:Uncharacterized protein n=1 Tax=Anguilla anguilla TaxID=7936 RepID=A0A0E9WND8_ANGAN
MDKAVQQQGQLTDRTKPYQQTQVGFINCSLKAEFFLFFFKLIKNFKKLHADLSPSVCTFSFKNIFHV